MVDNQGVKPSRQPGSTPPASTNPKTLDSQRVKGLNLVYQRLPIVTMQTSADTPHHEKDKKNIKKAHAGHTPHAAKQKGLTLPGQSSLLIC